MCLGFILGASVVITGKMNVALKDDKGTPLVPQENVNKGQLWALNPTKQVYRATLNKNPFLASKVQPLEVQDWTSVPPLIQY